MMEADDFLYVENGQVKVSDMAMQIPEFKDFKRYDSSTNKVFFNCAMSYIFYVYKVFGENRSYMYNMSLPQRKAKAVKHHTGTYKNLSDFEDNKWVRACVEAYLLYSRTRSEVLFDALKNDIDRYIDYVQNIPHSFKKTVKVGVNVLNEDNKLEERLMDVEVEVANTKERLEALKQAKDLDDLYKRSLADVNKDAKLKKVNSRRFENPVEVSKIVIDDNEFPISAE